MSNTTKQTNQLYQKLKNNLKTLKLIVLFNSKNKKKRLF